MYKHILLPTDGSALSREAVANGVLFARNLGATVVGVYVMPVPHADQLEAWVHHDPNHIKHRQAVFEKFADESLAFVSNSALAEEVPCACRKMEADEPYLAIVKAAEQTHCDLIYMASHGWKEDEGEVLGSQTVKVLHASKVSVLVHKSSYVRRRADTT